MKFARDILLIDIETTGPNPEKDFPLQIAGILLDKDNLLEKNYFNSYVRFPFSQTTNDRIVQTLGISKEQWIKTPNVKTVINEFVAKFPYNLTLASHNVINVNFLQASFKRAGLPYEYDYHILEIWTLGYLFLSKLNSKKIPTAETLGQYFKIQKEKEHDAFANCKFLVEIFKKLIKSY